MTPRNRGTVPAAPPYESPVERWLIEATQTAIGGYVYVDQTATDLCSVNAERRVICLRPDLDLDQLLYLLPRAAVTIMWGAEHLEVQPFPLRLVRDRDVPDQRAG